MGACVELALRENNHSLLPVCLNMFVNLFVGSELHPIAAAVEEA